MISAPGIDPLHRQSAQVIQGMCHTPSVQLATPRESAPHRHDLQIDQAWGRQLLTAQPGAKVVSVRSVVQQGDSQDTGINDEHARTATRSPRRPMAACPRLYRRPAAKTYSP